MEFTVNRAENGVTLQQFLASRLVLSRSAAKGLLDQRRVFVNGRRTWMTRHSLRTGDMVSGMFSPETPPSVSRAVFLYEDHDYLIVDKPAGILSNGSASLEQELIALTGNPELAACHRLDKDTSGCLLYAKHAEAKRRIIDLFRKNRIEKRYEAVLHGLVPEKSFSISKPLDGQKAVTHVRVLDANSSASHVLISLETGRTHQIRKHLSSIGHPALGDRQYGAGRAVSEVERNIARQMLHAVEFFFVNPLTGRSVQVRIKPPADMQECLKRFHLK